MKFNQQDRVDKGISAQVNHRTVRKPLRLHGSSKSATPYNGCEICQ